MNNKELIKLYIFYFNEYLSVDRFAEHHGFSLEVANMVLDAGKIAQAEHVALYKSLENDND